MIMGLGKIISRYGIIIATVFFVIFTTGITMLTAASIKVELGMTDNNFSDVEIPAVGTPTPESTVKRESGENTQSFPTGEEYILREYDGRIGIFRPENNEPVKVLQVYVMCLPEFDRHALRIGIRVIGEGELYSVIADFDG